MSTHRQLTFVVLAATAALFACQEKVVNIVAVASVQVSGGGSTLLPGGSMQLAATPKDDRNNTLTNRSITWSSSNSGVATVNASGLVQAVGAGNANINAQIEGVTGSTAITVNNPAPAISSVTPSSITAGSATLQLAVTGTNFVTASVVQWNTQDRQTQYVSATSLNATITAADIAATGTFTVSVRTPAPGGGQTGNLTVNVVNPQPSIISFSPATAIVGSTAFELTVTGSGFVPGAIVVWNGQDRTTQYVNATTLKATISAADIGTAGSINVAVRNPAPGGGSSAAKAFAINNPVPVFSSMSPGDLQWTDSPILGATLTVTGTGFVTGAAIRWNGQDQPTTFLSATQLRMSLTMSHLRTPGLVDVTVVNPAPGGGASAVRQFTITIQPPGPVISARRYSTCAVRGNGEAYCWGYNDRGQLGDGTTTDRTTPTRVQTTIPFVSIVTGSGHACGLTAWGAAYCWGSGGGYGTWNSTTPLLVSGGHPFIQLGAGSWHTCGVTSTGELWCWGDNYRGRLGDGTTIARSSPVQVGAGITWRRVFGGEAHTCGITSAGRMYCWGANWSGQLGDGTTADHLLPAPISGSAQYETAALGRDHTCAVSTGGAAWCWGWGALLGNASGSNSLVPVSVAGGQTFVSLAAALDHTCGVGQTGTAWCWGYGNSGQLGHGATWWANAPTAVTIPALRDIAAGELHSCAITTSGAAYCWGERTYGALGDGLSAVRLTPAAVTGASSGYGAIAVGTEFSCALAGNAARCWGHNASGQLGDGTNGDRTSPVGVVGGYSFARITTGGYHACGLTTTGVVVCWGEGNDGQLGNGSNLASTAPVAVAGGYRFVDIDAGANHTCGATTTGEVRCWGSNSYGQLGDGTNINRNVPTAAAGVTGLTFTRVSASEHHSCARTAAGQLYCWGENSDGEIGDGTQTDRSSPVRVNVPGTSVASVATGNWHTCAITDTGTYCWGFNGIGELGNGSSSSNPVLTPVAVLGNLAFTSLSLGVQASCGVTFGGAAYCWGENDWGQLGTGNLNWPNQPTLVAGGNTWVDVQLGRMHSCGVVAGGAVRCWGRLRYGELGIGISGMVLSPAAVQGGVVFNVEPCSADGCVLPTAALSTRNLGARGAAGARHLGPMPRVGAVEPARQCADTERPCPLPTVRFVR